LSKCDFRSAFGRPGTPDWPSACRSPWSVLQLTREIRRFVPGLPHSSPKWSSRTGRMDGRTVTPLRGLARPKFAFADTSATGSGQMATTNRAAHTLLPSEVGMPPAGQRRCNRTALRGTEARRHGATEMPSGASAWAAGRPRYCAGANACDPPRDSYGDTEKFKRLPGAADPGVGGRAGEAIAGYEPRESLGAVRILPSPLPLPRKARAPGRQA
jgi:hypothetical protein